jgi:hypothetical protein
VTPNDYLFAFVVIFWLAVFGWVKVSNWRAGKRWGDGPSLIPVIPTIPAAAFVLGWAVNAVASPWGLWVVVGLHATFVAGIAFESGGLPDSTGKK